MAVVFTSWTACTADGTPHTLDWASAAAIKGRMFWLYCEAIRQAIVERYAAVGQTPAAILQVPLAADRMVTQVWYDAVNAAMDAMCTGTVVTPNKWAVDATVDYTGQVLNHPPAWNMAALLTHLGQTRVTCDVPLATWARQQYDFLNHFTASICLYSALSATDCRYCLDSGVPPAGMWTRCEALWPAATWADRLNCYRRGRAGALRTYEEQNWDTGAFDAWGATIGRIRAKHTLPSTWSLPTAVTRDVQIYYKVAEWDGALSDDQFDAQGDAVVLGLNRTETAAAQTGTAYATGWLGNSDVIPPNTPDLAPAYFLGWQTADAVGVFNWAVPGGFTFVP